MKFFARHSALRQSVAAVLAAILSSGCVTWQSGIGRPDALIDQRPKQVWVSLEQGGRMILYAPTVAGDSLVGYRRSRVESSRIALPVRDVKRVEVERVDVARTSVLAIALSAAAVALVAGAAQWHGFWGGGLARLDQVGARPR
ncbi:MAG: hypothetical protein ABR998_06745 [Gemmatimonadales bacterium]|jgi:hypothetical protein